MQRATKILSLSLQARFLVLLIVGASGNATVAAAQSSGTFTRTSDMTAARSFHTATLLPNGKVLVAGGSKDSVSGLASAELYDPSTGVFTATGDMITARGGHSAILLPNGKVLMVGGYGTASYPNVAAAEIYDPASEKFTTGGTYVGRGGCDFCAPAILLADGKVLFPGQYPAQLYDPVTDSFSPSGMMISDQSAAILLTNGKVLFAGGEDFGRSSSAELYDPGTHMFAPTGNMAWRRVWHTLILLPNGTVLTTGGETDRCTGNWCSFAGTVASSELYDPSAGTFIATGSMAAPRETNTATLLNDGRVLIAGGASYGGPYNPDVLGFAVLTGAELYNPDVLVPAPALVSLAGDGQGQGAIFHAGTSHVAAPADPAVAGEVLDIDCTSLSNESVIPPQVAIGGRMAEVILFGKAPGVSGMNQIRVRVPSGIAPGPAVPVRLTYIGRPSNEVTIAVQ